MRFRSFAVSLFLVSLPALAHAESGVAPPTCALQASPRHGAAIPANAPVPFWLTAGHLQPRSITISKVTPETTFTTKPGAKSIHGEVTWCVPNTPLQENTTYTVAWQTDCPVTEPPGYEKPTQATFRTMTNVDLPTAIGTASVAETLADVRIDITPTKEFEAYLPLTALGIAIGERQLELGSAGDYGWAALSFDITASEACGKQRAVDIDQTITITAKIIGTDKTPTPLSVKAHFQCSQLATSSSSSSGDVTATDAGPDEPGAANGDNVSGQGCACQTPATAGVSFGPFVLAMIGVGLVRRRRERQ